MYDLANFSLRDMTECGAALRRLGDGAACMEDVAVRIVRYLDDNLVGPGGEPACALVRFFKTHAYADLDAEDRDFVDLLLAGRAPPPGMKCLTLLASAGRRTEWNSRHTSAGHKAIPLIDEEAVLRMPMIAQLFHQFGLEVGAVMRPAPSLLRELGQRTYNVFHVLDAAGSPYVPDQEGFVQPQGIRSVVGFGGVLSSADLFAVILFSRIFVPAATADLFKSLALSAKLAVLPFAHGPVFALQPTEEVGA